MIEEEIKKDQKRVSNLRNVIGMNKIGVKTCVGLKCMEIREDISSAQSKLFEIESH